MRNKKEIRKASYVNKFSYQVLMQNSINNKRTRRERNEFLHKFEEVKL